MNPFHLFSRLLALVLTSICILLGAGCAMPRHSTTLSAVLEQELGKDRALPRGYRCTIGAHRGSSVDFTENTLEALRAADQDKRYAFIEFDIQYTEDKRIIVFHDKRLFRLFGNLSSIGNTTYAELKELTGGEVCGYREAMDALDKKLNIEIKSQGDPEEDQLLAEELILDLRKRKRTKDVMISSISSDVLKYIHQTHPEIPTGKIHWLTASTYLHFDGMTRDLFEGMGDTGADYLLLHVANLSNVEDLIRLKPPGKTIVFWDFDDRIYLVHKDRSDRLWGQSALTSFLQSVQFKLLSPWRAPQAKPSGGKRERDDPAVMPSMP